MASTDKKLADKASTATLKPIENGRLP